MKNTFLLYTSILLFSLFSFNSFAQIQTVEAAIRYSNLNVGGTARTVGVGGALGALGADFAGVSINPAGLAMYRSSEFVLTPTFYIAKNDAQLRNASGSEVEKKNNFNINNIGIIIQNESTRGKWVNKAVAIGFNRVANFNREIYYEGATVGSLTDRNLEDVFLIAPEDFSDADYQAFEAAVLYRYDPDDNATWTTDYQESGGDKLLFKKQSISQKGAMNEVVIAKGANFNNKFMVGATVGIPFLSFEETKIYNEIDTEDEIDVFNEIHFEQTSTTSGIGINLKLGMVYRISQMFRFGVALHSPTRMALNDSYTDSLSYDLTTFDQNGEVDLNGSFDGVTPASSLDYRLNTPWKAIVSGAAIIGKKGFISADVEFMDYEFASFNLTSNGGGTSDIIEREQQVNSDIINQLTTAINIRIGGEYAIDKYRLRAGYSNYGSYAQTGEGSVQSISAGLGIREESFYADIAYQRSSSEDNYSPYRLNNPEDAQSVRNQRNNSRIMLTLGLKF